MRRIFTLFMVMAAVMGGLFVFLSLLALPAASATSLPTAPLGDGEWTPLGGPIAEGGKTFAVATLPGTPDTAYAAVAPASTYDQGSSTIYKTVDGAGSWSALGETGNPVYALATQGTQIYAGAFNPGNEGPVIYASGDSGVSWTPTLTATTRWVMYDLSIEAGDPLTALASGWRYNEASGYDEGVVYWTGDGGMGWSPVLTVTVPGQNSAVNAVLSHPISPTLVLAAAREGDDNNDTVIYRSEDGGLTWPDTITLPNAAVVSLVANTTQPNILYAGAGFGPMTWGRAVVFRSLDGGLTWDEVFDNGTHMAFVPPATVYTVMDSGQSFVSTSDGDPGTWMGDGGVWDSALDMALDPGVTPPQLYVGGERLGVFTGSYDGGFAWEQANNGIATMVAPGDIDVARQNPQRIFAVGDCVGAWRSSNGGTSWTQMAQECWHTLDLDEAHAGVIYAGRSDCSAGTILHSEDWGASFTPVYTPTFFASDCSGGDEAMRAVAIAASDGDTIYGAGRKNEGWSGNQAVVVGSQDGGASWDELFTMPSDSQATVMAVDPTDAQVAYVGGEDCSSGPCTGFVYATEDGGDNWSPRLVLSNTVSSLIVDYANPQVLYVADHDYRVQKSVDGGATWDVVRQPPWIGNEPSGNLLAIDPNVHDRLYLAGWGYIAESGDGGETWSPWDAPINNGAPQGEPNALAVDYGAAEQTLYAGFEGVWDYSRHAPVDGPRYVATTGSDTGNACEDPAAPCATIGHGIEMAYAGESIWIAEGTYAEHDLEIAGKTLTLHGGYAVDADEWTPDGGETIVDGGGAGRVFFIHGNNSTLRQLTITGGDTPDMQCWGGGLWVTNGNVTVRNAIIRENLADCSGGGLEVNSDFGPAHLALVDSLVVDNQSGGDAAGVSVWHTSASLTNTVIMGNEGSDSSAMRIEDGQVQMANATIVGNSGGTALSVYDTFGPLETTTIVNTILWDNGTANLACAESQCTVTYSDVEGGWTGAGNLDVDPLLVASDFHLTPESPLIDAGTGAGAPPTDIDGEGRPYGSAVDIGADEWWAELLYLPIVFRN